jgi:hypothetical protein
MPVYPSYRTWSDACGHNAESERLAAPPSKVDQIHAQFAARSDRQLLAEVKGKQTVLPGHSLGDIAATLLAVPIHLVTLSGVVLAVWGLANAALAQTRWDLLLYVVVASVGGMFAWYLAPAFPQSPRMLLALSTRRTSPGWYSAWSKLLEPRRCMRCG